MHFGENYFPFQVMLKKFPPEGAGIPDSGMEVTEMTETAETEKRCKIQTSQLPIIKHSMSDTVSPT